MVALRELSFQSVESLWCSRDQAKELFVSIDIGNRTPETETQLLRQISSDGGT